MSDMTSTEIQHVMMGHDAETVLNDPAISQALSDVREEIRKTIFNSTPDQQDVRENAYFMDAALTAVEKKLVQYINRARGIEALHDAEERQNG